MIKELDIAIIGMACRFPGADSVDAFWNNIHDGIESVSLFSDEELLDAGVNAEYLADPNYVKAGTVLPNADCFDAHFFGFSPQEATNMDPQHRIFLECAYEALEAAGCNPATYPGSIGVYAGCDINTYLYNHLLADSDQVQSSKLFQYMIGNDKDFLPTQVSYRLNLEGPSVNVQTACSTSLVAVHFACQSILNGECNTALAGGVSVHFPQISGYHYEEGMIMSDDGHCRAFDAKATGTVGGRGVGVVMLKRAEDAIADGDYIHGIIKGSAINNDGASKVGYTAPSVEGQAKVISEAHLVADVLATTIRYVETHGTATTLGDPIEIAALKQAFQTDEKGFCAIGSVKSNIGHANAAAGIAGLIKTVMALKNKTIPQSLYFETPSPQIDFADSPFYVNTTLKDWNSDDFPRRAGVSSFGIGGTNVHVVLEEAPTIPTTVQNPEERPQHLLCLSAKTKQALYDLCQRYATHLTTQPNISLANFCYTAYNGRAHFEYRTYFIARSITELSDKLTAYGTKAQELTRSLSGQEKRAKIAFLFTGQGAQYINMGQELYVTEPFFRKTMDHCDELLKPHLGESLIELLYPPQTDQHHTTRLSQTKITQVALFVLEYALAKLWQSWGVKPTLLMGHSVGELVAACFAGVFSLEDALRLVVARGRLMQKLPKNGRMFSIEATENYVREVIRPYQATVAIAAVNGIERVVISGDSQSMLHIVSQFETEGVKTHPLTVSHAFHSPQMDSILEDFRQLANTVTYSSPKLTLISNITGQPTTDISTADYWVRHIRESVRFADGFVTLLNENTEVIIEVGPKPTLLGLARSILKDISLSSNKHDVRNIVMLPSLVEECSDWKQMLTSLGKLYVYGMQINWQGLDQAYQRNKLTLPTYPFQRQRYFPNTAKKKQERKSLQSSALLATHPDSESEAESKWQQRPIFGFSPTFYPVIDQIEKTLPYSWEELLNTHEEVEAFETAPIEFDTLSIAYILTAFTKNGLSLQRGDKWQTKTIVQQLNVTDFYQKLLVRLLEILAEEGILKHEEGHWLVLRTPDIPNLETLETSYDQDAPPNFLLLQRCGKKLAEVLQGTQDPLALLFPSGDTSLMTEVYTETSGLNVFNELLRDVVQSLITDLPRKQGLQILEVGGGTGGSTRWLLPHLPAKQTQYTFTDIGTAFTTKAKTTFIDYDFIRYKVLNIEQSPTDQGFALQQYDMIIAANVLHATKNLADTLTHVRSLLKPSGILLLIETTKSSYLTDLTAGLTEGWWHFNDKRNYPLISVHQWQDLLAEHGFKTTLSIPSEDNLGQALLVAQAEEQSLCTNQQWLLFTDEVGTSEVLATKLRNRADDVVIVRTDSKYQKIDENNFTIRPNHIDDYKQLIASLPNVTDILHCWSLNTSTPSTTNSVSTVHQNCGTTLHLVQALLNKGLTSPKLWLITQGAQAVNNSDCITRSAQAALCSIGKTIAFEHPELNCVCIDLEENIEPSFQMDALCGIITSKKTLGKYDYQLALRKDYCYVAPLTYDDLQQIEKNSKVSAFPADDWNQVNGENIVVARTPSEITLSRIWSEVLGIEHVSINDDFLEIGGDSLVATQIIPLVRRNLQVELPLSILYELGTVAKLGNYIDTALQASQNLQQPIDLDDEEIEEIQL